MDNILISIYSIFAFRNDMSIIENHLVYYIHICIHVIYYYIFLLDYFKLYPNRRRIICFLCVHTIVG